MFCLPCVRKNSRKEPLKIADVIIASGVDFIDRRVAFLEPPDHHPSSVSAPDAVVAEAATEPAAARPSHRGVWAAVGRQIIPAVHAALRKDGLRDTSQTIRTARVGTGGSFHLSPSDLEQLHALGCAVKEMEDAAVAYD